MGRRNKKDLSSSESESDSDVEVKSKKSSKKSTRLDSRASWVWVLPFALLWLGLFYGVTVRYASKLPTPLTNLTEAQNKGRFIAGRAWDILANYEAIGPKVVGSNANEEITVDFLLDEIDKIKKVLNTKLYSLETNVQQASGAFIHWEMTNMYQGLQNVVVKLANKTSISTSYLLINTHFDTKPGSPGAGDPGAMVVVMLEVLRVLASGNATLIHPIIFLFNGAEENPLQGSHAFITQHKWAKNCKALINLDSAGSGNRDIVFQSGPRNPWIMKYYKQAAVHPYATTVAEELFQLNIIPSDTDFRNFQKFGSVPGLDMAHTYNGYVYHTKYDKANAFTSATVQNTGDNILSLAKAFSNAPELEDPSKYAAGATVFYDLLGQYLVIYTSAQGIELNYGVSIAAAVLVFFSISFISANTSVTFVGVLGRFILSFIVQVIGLVLGAGLTVGLGIYLDILGVSMSWFTFKWVVLGLYFAPFIFGLALPSVILIAATNKDKLSIGLRTQLLLNSQLIVVALASAGVTYYGLKSAYLLMLATLLYGVSLIINILTTLYRRGLAWFWVVVLLQIPAFVYFTYVGYIFFSTLIPMMGRFGPTTNPDLYISGLSALIGVLALGFIVPLINLFKKPVIPLIAVLLIALGFIGLALSPYGFPFRPATNVQRFDFVHTRRVFHEANLTVSKNESGYYFNPNDRKGFTAVSSVFNISKVVSVAPDCAQYMFCGLPVYNHRWNRAKQLGQWLPSGPASPPGIPKLKLVDKDTNIFTSTIQYKFSLDGPDHMGIFIGPLPGSNLTDWSFLPDMLVDGWAPPYFIYFSKARDQSTLNFCLTFKKTPDNLKLPTFEIGIGGHYGNYATELSAENAAFIQSFPPYTFLAQWSASYERWIY